MALAAMLVFAAPAGAATQTIAFPNGNLSYNPANPTIKTGDTVTFSGDFMGHPLVWDSGEEGDTTKGSSASFSNLAVGVHPFHCAIHQSQGMVGTITVVQDQHPAYVSFSVSPAQPGVGQPATFTYTGSADPDGSLVRWEWDLDGDGSFETATPTGTASTTYASARSVTVRMRAVDDSGEPSAVASQAVTVVAAGSGASGSGDTTAPKATRVKLRGLKLTFRSSERASATAKLRARGKTVASGSAKATNGAIAIRLQLTKSGRTLLPRGHKLRAKLTLTLRDATGNRSTVTRQLTVKRP